MPAEAIHLSALDDTRARADASTRAALGAEDSELRALSRLGAVLIDLPYFDRFALGVLRYLLGRTLTASPFGDALHGREPVHFATLLLRQAAKLRAHEGTRRDGERVLALALGYLSHLAVDSSLHPLVNRLAAERAARLGDPPSRQHTEVEKFHSILFHEERHGFDFMGEPRVAAYISVDASALFGEAPLACALQNGLAAIHGAAPGPKLLARWTRGYGQYTHLLASPFGRRLMPSAVKEAVRGEVYDAPYGRFVDHYERAVRRSEAYVAAGLALAESSGGETAFAARVPEGSVDDPPYATNEDRGR